MSSLDDIKKVLAQGDKEGAIRMLVSKLRLNEKDVDTWLLLGEVIDDPAKKKDCYNQVLKLSPSNPIAVNGLRNLNIGRNITVEKLSTPLQDNQPRKVNKKASTEPDQNLRANFQYHQRSKSAQSFENMKDDWKGVGIAILGVGGFFGITYILGLILTSFDSSGESDPLCTGVICLGLIVGVFTWYTNSKNRSETANTAIKEQKRIQSSRVNVNPSSKNKAISCRVCQHTVSRTAPSCPNCGELYPGLISKCPYCSSKNIRIAPKGFSLGKAAAGAVIAGPLGAAGGLHGRKDLEVKCSNCYRTLTIKHDEI